MQILIIRSNKYGADLTYSVNAAEADPDKRVKLDTLQLLVGEGGVELFGDPPQKLFSYNGMGQDGAIQILVGKKATTS